MLLTKLIALPAIALTAGLSLAASSGGTTTFKPATLTRTVATSESPVGIWNVSYAESPTAFFGQYAITQSGETYTLTVKTPVAPPELHCALPVGTEEGTFTATGPTTFAGTGKEWYTTTATCIYGDSVPITLQFVNRNELTLLYANGGGPLSFILSRPGHRPRHQRRTDSISIY